MGVVSQNLIIVIISLLWLVKLAQLLAGMERACSIALGTHETCTIWILDSKYMSYMTWKDSLLCEVGSLVNSLKKLDSRVNFYASRYSLFVFKK